MYLSTFLPPLPAFFSSNFQLISKLLPLLYSFLNIHPPLFLSFSLSLSVFYSCKTLSPISPSHARSQSHSILSLTFSWQFIITITCKLGHQSYSWASIIQILNSLSGSSFTVTSSIMIIICFCHFSSSSFSTDSNHSKAKFFWELIFLHPCQQK